MGERKQAAVPLGEVVARVEAIAGRWRELGQAIRDAHASDQPGATP
jgi:hypothetical protein